jgi:hypothetical protein
MIRNLYLRLLRLMQSRCTHPGSAVKADILESAVTQKQLQWCEICGAHRMMYWSGIPFDSRSSKEYSEWRSPRPDFYIPRPNKPSYGRTIATVLAIWVLLLALTTTYASLGQQKKIEIRPGSSETREVGRIIAGKDRTDFGVGLYIDIRQDVEKAIKTEYPKQSKEYREVVVRYNGKDREMSLDDFVDRLGLREGVTITVATEAASINLLDSKGGIVRSFTFGNQSAIIIRRKR